MSVPTDEHSTTVIQGAAMNVRVGSQRKLGSVALLSLATLLLALSLLAFAAFRPVGYSDAKLRQIAQLKHEHEIIRYYEVVAQGTTTKPLRLPLTPLVDLEVTINMLAPEPPLTSARVPGPAAKAEEALRKERSILRTQIRWELVVSALLGLLVLLRLAAYALRKLSGYSSRLSMSAEKELTPDGDGVTGVQPAAPKSVVGLAEEVFLGDVERLRARAEEFNLRSELYLVAGLGVAVIGLLIFLLAPRPAITGDETTSLLTASIQPTALLLFTEAIAFFLLRQNRVMVAYHSHFVALVLKRNNWVAACRLVEGNVLDHAVGPALISGLYSEMFPSTGVLGMENTTTTESREGGASVIADLLHAAGTRSEKK